MEERFKIIILIARPAAGKSEVIHYLKRIDENERLERFHIGAFEEIDDFPMLWTWFEEDAILEKMGKGRLHTTPDGYFKYKHLWHLLIRRIELQYSKKLRNDPAYHRNRTCIIEFSRGSEHGGYEAAFSHFSRELLSRAAVLYIDVSYEESLRKNRRRFNPDKPDSILEHGLPDEKMERLYKDTDWSRFSAGDPAVLDCSGLPVPYVVFPNDDDVTTEGGEVLGNRLEERLSVLWKRYNRDLPEKH
jgi:hypothetical protein